MKIFRLKYTAEVKSLKRKLIYSIMTIVAKAKILKYNLLKCIKEENYMTTLKEKIIALSRNEIMRKFMVVYAIITLVLLALSYFFELEPILSIVIIVTIVLYTIYGVLYAIRKQEMEIVKNNKLIYIILSDDLVLFSYIMFYICCPILQILLNIKLLLEQ